MYFLSGFVERLKYTTLSDPPRDLDLDRLLGLLDLERLGDLKPLDLKRLGDLERLYRLDLLLLDADLERDLDLLLRER